MMKVYIATDPIDASMARDILVNNGIEAIVQGEALFGLQGAMPFSETSPTVWVADDADFEAAVNLLTEYFYGKKQPKVKLKTETRICRKCGEEVESSMDSCWNCGNEI